MGDIAYYDMLLTYYGVAAPSQPAADMTIDEWCMSIAYLEKIREDEAEASKRGLNL